MKTFGDVLEEYEFHPESKCADADGNVCGKQTVGLLQRRHIEVDRVIYIGKESNRLEDAEAGMIHDEGEVYTEYVDPRRDEWETKIRPALTKISLPELVKLTGFSRRTLLDWRAGRSRPHGRNEKSLAELIKFVGKECLQTSSAKLQRAYSFSGVSDFGTENG